MNGQLPPWNAEDRERDERWLAEIATGGKRGRAALFELSQAYDPLFLLFLENFGLGRDEADRVLDETWLRVSRRAAQYDPLKGNPGALIWHILKAEAAEGYKKQAAARSKLRFGLVDEGESLPDNPDVPVWAHPPELDVMLRRCMEKAMATLRSEDPDGANLLWLRTVAEWKPAELAAADGRTVGTISTMLSKVRNEAARLMRPCLEGRVKSS